jgi:cAMP phosphodiesterase
VIPARSAAPLLAFAFWLLPCLAAPEPASPSRTGFTLVALGTSGGLRDGRLSSYLLAAAGSSDFVALDAGTQVAGIERAVARGHFQKRTASDVLRSSVRAVLLSHAHLDHILGLVISSPDDAPKPLYALPETLDTLRDHVFNGRVWANFGSEGAEPRLGKYAYLRLRPGEETPLLPTAMTVEAYPLCHARQDASTAFLVRGGGAYVLYLGDTGADSVESCDRLGSLWRRIASLVREGRLRALLIEASYPDPRPAEQLYGHLTPERLMAELARLAEAVGPDRPQGALARLAVVVTHVKPSLTGGPDPRRVILRQLADAEAKARLGVRFLMPEDGDRLALE